MSKPSAPPRHRPESSSASLEPRWLEWQATLDPRAYWPGLSRASFDRAACEIVRVTQKVLAAGGDSVELRIGNGQTEALAAAAYVSGMGGLLGLWVERGAIGAEQRVAEVLGVHLRHGRRRFVALDTELSRILGAFSERGVRAVVLKGMHTARTYFADPGARPLADIDLLIPPSQFEKARDALSRIGLRESRRTRRPFRSEWVPEGGKAEPSLEVAHADNPWTVDLHERLERRYFRGLTAGFPLSDDRDLANLAVRERRALALAQPVLTAFLALHAGYAIHQLQLIRLVELVFVIRRDTGEGTLRWEALRDLLERTETARFVYPALELPERLAPGTLPIEFRDALRRTATARSRRVVDEIARGGTFRLSRRSLAEKLMWARGPGELARNLTELLMPADQRLTLGNRWKTRLRFGLALARNALRRFV